MSLYSFKNWVVTSLVSASLSSITFAAEEFGAGSGQTLLHQDTFNTDLSQWVVEQAEGGSVELKKGQLVINDAKGCTVWFKKKLAGSIAIEFEATLVDAGGKYDRVSDLNCFWMAIDPKHPKNIFENTERGGDFSKYDSLRLYYVGYGANKNTTTRFRRYPGDGTRPCLPEHDLKLEKFLNKPNRVVKVRIVADGEKVQYLRDGEVVFSINDEDPFTEGWFGFRTVRNHLKIDNFKVYSLDQNND